MEDFWQIIKTWDHFGQAIFLLIVIGGVASLISILAYYVTVIFRGWPEGHAHQHVHLSEDDEGWVHECDDDSDDE